MRADETRPAPCTVSGSGDRLPLAAIEAVRARPTERVVFAHAKIVAVMQGRITIDSPAGPHELAAGDLFVLGLGCGARLFRHRWCGPGRFIPTRLFYVRRPRGFCPLLRESGLECIPRCGMGILWSCIQESRY